MELNKYDLVEFLASHYFGDIECNNCPIREECDKRENIHLICSNKDETKETLIKKYNL